jgi:transposase
VFSERTSVGLDVHARSVVACAIDTMTGEMIRQRLTPEHAGVLGWIRALPGPVAVAYEAGPTGFGLARALSAALVRCEVVAPSKLQRPAGDRIKTDARDALHLARLLRLDEVVSVRVPSAAEEAARDLVRAREDVRGDLMRARHRVSKLLLRQGLVYTGAGGNWRPAHNAWLQLLRFENVALQAAYEAAYEAVVLTEGRRARLDKAIAALASDSPWSATVARLGCLRGVDTLTAFGLAVEIGDWERFTGSSIGAFLGLVPSESSSGASRSQGPITKSGNSHARRLLVEAAWHHRRRYRVGTTIQARWQRAPAAARARGHLGNQRLNHRWQTFTAHHKKPVVANVAIARELAGWCWSLATLPE